MISSPKYKFDDNFVFALAYVDYVDLNVWHLRKAFNLSPLSAAYMGQWIRSALVQIMACRLFGAKPFSKPMLEYCYLDP